MPIKNEIRLEKTIDALKEKYKGNFEITNGENGWVRIKGLVALGKEYPTVERPAFIDYNVEVSDPRFGDTLDDRSRNVWIRNSQGSGLQSVSYCSGMGIWQVSEGIEPMPFGDLNPGSREMVKRWLGMMDSYISSSIPELEKLIKDRNKR